MREQEQGQEQVFRDLTDPRRARKLDDLEGGLRLPTYDNVVVPEEFGPVIIDIDEHKLRRYAFQQADYGRYSDTDGTEVAPAGLIANDLLQLFTTVFAASQVVGLHTEEELWFDRPILPGSRLALAGRYVDKFERRGQGYVVMEAEARDTEGRLVVRHRGLEIMRTAPAEVRGRGSAGEGGRRVTGEYDEQLPLASRLRADVRPGTGLVPLRKETTIEQMAMFSRLGEFVTNIHNDLRTARAAGLQVPIVQGQQLVCYMAELLHRSFGADWLHGGHLHVKFLTPVDAYDSVTVQGAVREIGRDGSRVHIALDVWVRHDEGRLAAVGWAEGSLPADRAGHTAPSGARG